MRIFIVRRKAKTDSLQCMNYNFFADKEDKLKILDFIFCDTDLKIYDLSSSFGHEISEYKTLNEISSKFDLESGDKFAVTFQLWTPRHKGKPIFRKIELDPRRCNGHSFRYSTDGWGLIQMYFGGLKNNQLNQSHIGHFNEKGALGRELANNVNGKVADWDWTEIQATSRRLKYHIHNKLATKKIGSLGVLAGAEQLEKSGITLT
jgi:hypothetical protein